MKKIIKLKLFFWIELYDIKNKNNNKMVPVKKIEIEIEKVYTPKPIRMSHNNIFTFKKAIRTPIEKKKLEDISIEEINNDFKLFKTKSEERLCYEEVLSILSNPITRPNTNDNDKKKIERCVNPFYKNFPEENENEENIKK